MVHACGIRRKICVVFTIRSLTHKEDYLMKKCTFFCLVSSLIMAFSTLAWSLDLPSELAPADPTDPQEIEQKEAAAMEEAAKEAEAAAKAAMPDGWKPQ